MALRVPVSNRSRRASKRKRLSALNLTVVVRLVTAAVMLLAVQEAQVAMLLKSARGVLPLFFRKHLQELRGKVNNSRLVQQRALLLRVTRNQRLLPQQRLLALATRLCCRRPLESHGW
jgi:hypothetical protein